jgi:hypothetical protein
MRADHLKSKQAAHHFLIQLEAHLNSTIPPPAEVRAKLAAAIAMARSAARRTADRHSSFAEGAFLNTYVLGGLHVFLMSELGFSPEDARLAVLSESYRGQPQFASGSPVRPGPHPFRKVIGVSSRQVVEIWRGKAGVNPLARSSCPDLALRAPSPYRVVFEAKYHSSQSQATAEAELEKNTYQAFFYLALPRFPATTRHAAWDYEFACVLAYDATPDGYLLQAWKSLSDSVKAACWTGANVYVMILRGSPNAASV